MPPALTKNEERTTENVSAFPPTPPSLKEIDTLIAEYAVLQQKAMAIGVDKAVADKAAGIVKASLTAMVEQFGARHTEKSKRLAGLHNTATTTTASRVCIDSTAVDTFKSYLDGADMPDLVEKFFSSHTSYSLIAGPAEVLKTLTLGKRIRDKMTSLLGLCNKITVNAPSLKIEVIEAEKPAKAQAA